MKKIFLLLSIILLTSLSATAEELYAVLSNNNRTLTIYYDDSRVQRLGGLINESNNSQQQLPWYNYAAGITKVCFDATMADFTFSNIFDAGTAFWFYGFTNLTTIEGIEYLNTEKAKSMWCMFYGCTSLTTLDLSTFRTANVYNMVSMFEGCSNLTSLDISNFETTGISYINNMFKDCSNLQTIYCNNPKFGLSQYQNQSSISIFEGCVKLVGGSGFTYSSDCVSLKYASPRDNGYFTMLPYAKFYQGTLSFCYDTNKYTDVVSLNRFVLDVRPFDSMESRGWNDKLTNITKVVFHESMANCHTLTSTAYWLAGITNPTAIEGLDNLNTENVTDMKYMFADCQNITSLDLRGFNTENATDMEGMFYHCNRLETIFCNDAWTAQNSSDMFMGCTDLVGGNNFSYSNECVTADYASPSVQGYFTKKAELYVMLSDNNQTLTFYYGYDRVSQNGMSFGSFTSADGRRWNNYSRYITKVIFDESMSGCTTLTSTAFWFYGFSNLSTISGLEHLNTANVTNMSSMFRKCSSLTSLDARSLNTANVTNMSFMFSECSNLTSLDVSSFNTANVTNMNAMFSGCSNLTSLNVKSFNTANVTNMFAMFSECSNLTSLNVNNFNTANVFDFSYMFSNCSNLSYLDVRNFNTTKVHSMSSMFRNCSSLTSLDLRSFNTAGVYSMSYMFSDCSLLKTIYCDEDWYRQGSDGGSKMFNGCTRLVGGQGFSYSENCTSVVYANPGEQGYFTKREPYALLSDSHKTLTFYYGVKPADGLEVGPFTSASRREWHENCTLITKVEFDKSMENCTSITSTAYWFSGLFNLTDIEGLKYLNTENVTDMKYMFNDCEKLTSIELNGFKTAKVTDMSYMFNNCQTLQSLDVSDFKTAEVTDMNKMFYLCMNLASLDVSGFNTAKVTNMSNMFCNCGVTTIYCDDDWYNPDIFSDYMFDGCWNLVGGSGFGFDEDCVSGKYANPREQGYFTMKTYRKGDVNGDGKVTPADAIMILYHYFNVKQYGFKIQAADLNGDGNITPADAIETLYKYFGNGNHNARATRPTTSDSRNPE